MVALTFRVCRPLAFGLAATLAAGCSLSSEGTQEAATSVTSTTTSSGEATTTTTTTTTTSGTGGASTTTTTSSTGGGGSGGSGGNGGTGGSTECMDATECPGQDTECQIRTCVGGLCGMQDLAAMTTCTVGGDVCDGAGSCVKSDGTTCGAAAECLSAFCSSGVCCDTACAGECDSCTTGVCTVSGAGSAGTPSCAPYVCDGVMATCATTCAGNMGCVGAFYCDPSVSMCAPQKGGGAGCMGAAECLSGFCTDGFCCDMACSGTCESCGLAGSAGVCSYQPVGTDPELDCGGGVCDGAGTCAVGTPLWALNFGDGAEQRALSTATDPAGNVYVSGYYKGSLTIGATVLPDPGGGKKNIFLAKLNPGGTVLWAKRFGANSQDSEGTAVATDLNNNVVLTGYYRTTIDFGGGALTDGGGKNFFVAGFDAAGNNVWSKTIITGSSADDEGSGIATDSMGNVLVTGYYKTTADFGGGFIVAGSGNRNIFIAKFSAAGAHLSSVGLGTGPLDDEGFGIASDAANNVFITGYYIGTPNFGGGALANAGTKRNVFAAGFSPTLTHLWSFGFGDVSQDDDGYGIAVDTNGDVLLTGKYKGTMDFSGGAMPLMAASGNKESIYVAKLAGANGGHLWSKGFTSGTDSSGYKVATDGSDNIVVTGFFQGTMNFGGGAIAASAVDIFAVKYAPAGPLLWSKRLGGTGDDIARGLGIDATGNIFLAGYFSGVAGFGVATLTSAGSDDIFAMKMAP